MSKDILKQLIILSFILGIVLGFISIIPFINLFSFLTMVFLSSSIVIIHMKKRELIGKLTPRDGALYGGVTGFCSSLGFCMILIPLAVVISYFVPDSLTWYSSMGMWFQGGVGGMLVLLMLVVFVAFLCALFNAFTGLATVFFYSQLLNEEQENETFHIDI